MTTLGFRPSGIVAVGDEIWAEDHAATNQFYVCDPKAYEVVATFPASRPCDLVAGYDRVWTVDLDAGTHGLDLGRRHPFRQAVSDRSDGDGHLRGGSISARRGYAGGVTAKRSLAPRCNIGPDEVARRRRSAIFTSGLFAVVAVGVVALDVPPVARFLAWPLGAAVGITWLQVASRFCVAFGALGIENFGRLGSQVRVDAAQRAADRRRALLLIGEGAVIGLALTLAIVPIRL